MRCTVCGAPTAPCFTKKFSTPSLESVEYVRCVECGLVMAKTLLELDPEAWEKLNERMHGSYQGDNAASGVDPQWVNRERWLERLRLQAEAIAFLIGARLLPAYGSGLDYGGGDGKLVTMLAEKNIHFSLYDKYMRSAQANIPAAARLEDVAGKTFDVVVSCAVMEHLLSGREIEALFGLVKAETGVFALHTLVCEEVPGDPEWFYLLAGHSLMYTNKSMDILYRRHGFKACLYAVDARMWFFFRDAAALDRFRELRPKGSWAASPGFVDYWKTAPYRN